MGSLHTTSLWECHRPSWRSHLLKHGHGRGTAPREPECPCHVTSTLLWLSSNVGTHQCGAVRAAGDPAWLKSQLPTPLPSCKPGRASYLLTFSWPSPPPRVLGGPQALDLCLGTSRSGKEVQGVGEALLVLQGGASPCDHHHLSSRQALKSVSLMGARQ